MPTIFTTAEEYVPSTDKRLPSFGVIVRDPVDQDGKEVVLVFDEGTPMLCQLIVRDSAEKHFLHTIGIPEYEISRFVAEKLEGFVSSRQLRRNEFTQQWVWLGED